MRIVRARIKNYRNLRSVDVPLGNLVALVGENNSGKSNFLRAISLPLSLDDGGGSCSKNLSWFDINNEAKEDYYAFVEEHREEIVRGDVGLGTLQSCIPSVSVTVDLQGDDTEGYDLKDILAAEDDGGLVGRICYRWHVMDPLKLLECIKILLDSEDEVQAIKMSLLPMDLFRHEIVVPDSENGHRVSYDTLTRFKYAMLPAERDNFAASSDKLGSRALIGLLQEKLDPVGLKNIEQGYGSFLETIRTSAKLDEIINWQDYSDAPRAKEFFDDISVLPNMPAMGSILGSIRLGYGDESMALQGLGHRNLIIMAVLLNSYLIATHDISLRVVAVEEPEAHLCINNVLLMASLFKAFGNQDCRTQLIYSTHDTEFVNKVGLERVIILHGGRAFSLRGELEPDELCYLAKNPNTDIFKMLFSRRLVLVEGITEELLIKSYLQTRPGLDEIKVMSFHKGYRDIIRIWKKINEGNGNKLGIVRDFDDQPKAKDEHDALDDEQVCVRTTGSYTLEPEIVDTRDNFRLLLERYGAEYGWTGMTKDELQADWRSGGKAGVMLEICHDLIDGELQGFTMPRHIQEVLDFLLGLGTAVSSTQGTVHDED